MAVRGSASANPRFRENPVPGPDRGGGRAAKVDGGQIQAKSKQEDHDGLVRCSLVEAKPGVQRDRPVLKGTRMPANDIVENWEAGIDEPDIDENFRLPVEHVKAILSYAATHRNDPRPVR